LRYKKPIDHERKFSYKQWEDHFNLDLIKTKNRQFAHEITTDGYVVNITMKRVRQDVKPPYDLKRAHMKQKLKIIDQIRAAEKIERAKKKAERDARKALLAWNKEHGIKTTPVKRVPKKQELPKEIITNWDFYKHHGGLDPGKRSLFTIYFDDDTTVSATAGEYHEHIGLNKFRRQMKSNKTKKELDQFMALHSFKVSSSMAYLKSIKEVIRRLDEIKSEYIRGFYRKNKLLRHKNKHKAYKMLYEKIIKGRDGPILIGYGSGSCNGKGIKGSSMPVKSFYEFLLIQEMIKIVKINESYTTKMCSKCEVATHCIHQHKYIETSDKKWEKKKVKIYALRRCKNECHKSWNRDDNASRNIYVLLKTEACGKERPTYLCRPPKKDKKKKKDGVSVPRTKKVVSISSIISNDAPSLDLQTLVQSKINPPKRTITLKCKKPLI
jgi:hypothetical protein